MGGHHRNGRLMLVLVTDEIADGLRPNKTRLPYAACPRRRKAYASNTTTPVANNTSAPASALRLPTWHNWQGNYALESLDGRSPRTDSREED